MKNKISDRLFNQKTFLFCSLIHHKVPLMVNIGTQFDENLNWNPFWYLINHRNCTLCGLLVPLKPTNMYYYCSYPSLTLCLHSLKMTRTCFIVCMCIDKNDDLLPQRKDKHYFFSFCRTWQPKAYLINGLLQPLITIRYSLQPHYKWRLIKKCWTVRTTNQAPCFCPLQRIM